MFKVHCGACDTEARIGDMRCRSCNGILRFSYPDWNVESSVHSDRGVARYRTRIPLRDEESNHVISLGEGGTPLLKSSRYTPDVYFKLEFMNPTGSHKDRQLAIAVDHARSLGHDTVAVVSAGSTGLSCAAYCAKAGLKCVIFMSKGAPKERVYPAFQYGADIVEVDESVDDILDEVDRLCGLTGIYHASTASKYNPYQSEGPKTIAYEICSQLGSAPSHVVVPVGGGGTIAALGRGFRELRDHEIIDVVPKLVGCVPSHLNSLLVAFDEGVNLYDDMTGWKQSGPETDVQTKLSHLRPPDAQDALTEVRDSGGWFVETSDDFALDHQRALAMSEGLYVEPSSAVVAKGIESVQAQAREGVHVGATVALLSGSGFRETSTSMSYRPSSRRQIGLLGLGPFFDGLS